MKASEALLLSEQFSNSIVEKESEKILEEIKNAAMQGRVSIVKVDIFPSVQSRLKELGYIITEEWYGQKENGHSYFKVSWK